MVHDGDVKKTKHILQFWEYNISLGCYLHVVVIIFSIA